MKLRYYMRGLGIGMLVTAAILVLAGRPSESLTDDQIKARAAKLGMVMEDEQVLAQKTTQSDENEMKTEQNEVPVETTETLPERKPEAQEQPEQKPEVETQEQEPEQTVEEQEPMETVSLVIQGGSSSVSVANQAEQLGLVESGADFDRFLCQNGYDKKICVGTYHITLPTTEEEIAKIITRK